MFWITTLDRKGYFGLNWWCLFPPDQQMELRRDIVSLIGNKPSDVLLCQKKFIKFVNHKIEFVSSLGKFIDLRVNEVNSFFIILFVI